MAVTGLPFSSPHLAFSGPDPLLETSPKRPVSKAFSRPFSMAFQPVVDLLSSRVIAYEALVRGHRNEPAASILVPSRTVARNTLDRVCRLTAIEIAACLGVMDTGADLCINVNLRPAFNDIPSLPATVAAAERAGLPLNRLVLEISEEDRLRNPHKLEATLERYRRRGLRIAIDDFGAGFAGLSLLAAFRPDMLKIDIALTRDIHKRRASRVIVKSIVGICREMEVQIVAEGIEEGAQVEALQDLGIHYMQGHYFAEPAFESLPAWPGESLAAAI